MNYTKSILILLVLCLCIVPAIATSSDYHSKYSNPTLITVGTTGFLEGTIRCGVNDFTKEIGVRNDANPLGKNGSFTYYPISPDGKFADFNGNSRIELIPGSFSLHIVDGQGGQPEDSHVTIVAGQISYPEKELLGHAVSPASNKFATPETSPIESNGKIRILSAYYGARWVTYTNRGSTEHGQYIQIGSLLQHQIDLGYTSFKFNIATITDASGNALVTIPSGDPVPGIVKNVIVIYTIGNNPIWHVKEVMEQDYHNPYTYPSAQVPYLPLTPQTVLTL